MSENQQMQQLLIQFINYISKRNLSRHFLNKFTLESFKKHTICFR
jgi:hypothetical protein